MTKSFYILLTAVAVFIVIYVPNQINGKILKQIKNIAKI